MVFFSGLVYNVTPYMEFHPGGEEEMMRGAGIDGTALFDEVKLHSHLTPAFEFSRIESIATIGSVRT